jgi:hypothetical protein
MSVIPAISGVPAIRIFFPDMASSNAIDMKKMIAAHGGGARIE